MFGHRSESPTHSTHAKRAPIWTALWTGFSLRGKIVVPFLALTVLTALVATFIVTRLVAGSARERFTNQLYESSRLAASAVVDQETAHLSVLRLMVFTNGLDVALRSGDVA